MFGLLGFGCATPLPGPSSRSTRSVQSNVRRVVIHASIPSQSRRRFLFSVPPLMLGALPSGGIHTELSELASMLPGVGMPDVYYPSFFVGDWLVSRDLYAVETPSPVTSPPASSPLSASAITQYRDRIGMRLAFTARFFGFHGKIVEDRLANERAISKANYPHERIEVKWDVDNPNVMSVARGGAVREVKVTKRSFVDGPQGYGTFVASEYARVVDVGTGGVGGGNVGIFGRRRIVRYRVSSVTDEMEPDGMDRIVVDYLYPAAPVDAKAAVVLKYRDFLNRKREGFQLLRS